MNAIGRKVFFALMFVGGIGWVFAFRALAQVLRAAA